MARDPRYDVLFEPVPIGPKTLRNRFYATSQCSGFGSDRPAINAYHRAMKAAGGYSTSAAGFGTSWPVETSGVGAHGGLSTTPSGRCGKPTTPGSSSTS